MAGKDREMEGAASQEFYKKLNQQIVQKDNMIRLLQMQLKKYKEQGEGGASSGELIEKIAEQENKIRELEEQLQLARKGSATNVPGLDELKASEARLAKKVMELEEQLATERDRVSSLKNELMKKTGDGGDAALMEKLREQQSLAEELKKELAAQAKELEEARSRLETVRNESRKLKEELDGVRAELDRTKEQKRQADEKLKEYELELEHVRSGQKEPALRGLALLEKYLDTLEHDRIDSKKYGEILRSIRDEMALKIAELSDELTGLRAKEIEYNELLRSRDELQRKLERLQERSMFTAAPRVESREPVSDTKEDEQITGQAIRILIDIMDDFQVAYSFLDAGDMQSFKLKVNNVYDAVREMLRIYDVSPIPTIGESFDAALHEIVEYVRSREQDDDIVIDELRRGWMRGNEVIRQARVRVVKNRFKCTNCGNISRVGSVFCDSCGTKLETRAINRDEIKNTGEMFYQTGKIFEERGLYEKALEHYEQAVRMEPENTHFAYSLARALEYLGRYNEALEYFKKILKIDPRKGEVRQHIENIEIKQEIIRGLSRLATGR